MIPKIGIARVGLSAGGLQILDNDRHTLCLHPSPVHFDRILGRRVEPFFTDTGFIGIVPSGTDCAINIRSASADVIRVSIDADHLRDIAIEVDTSLSDVMTDRHSCDLMMLHLALAYLGEDRREHPDPMSLEATANAMLVHLLRRFAERARSDSIMLSPRLLSKINDYVCDRLQTRITIADMAAVAGLSTFHFSRIFAATTGITPHRYVMSKRTARAVNLLRTTRLSLSEIADECGFSDQSHLARWIRSRHNVTPQRLRQQLSLTNHAPDRPDLRPSHRCARRR